MIVWPHPHWTQRRAIFLGIVTGLACGGLLTAALWYSGILPKKPLFSFPTTSLQTTASPTPSPTPTPDPLAPSHFVLMGYGGAGHAGGGLTDTLLLVSLHPRQREVFLVSLPRDLWVPLNLRPETPVWSKVNAAWELGRDQRQYSTRPERYQGELGGFRLLEDTLQTITGLPISGAVGVDFSAFTRSIDLLGGLTVTVPQTFTDPWYPVAGKETDPCGKSPEEIAATTATLSGFLLEQQFPCRYETLSFTAGPTTLDGETALKFVRSRHSGQSGNDFARSERQRALLIAAREKLLQPSNIPQLPSLAQTAWKSVQTDMNLADVLGLATKFPDIREYTLTPLALTDKNVLQPARSSDGQYILQPRAGSENWSEIQSWLQSRFRHEPESTPSASSTPRATLRPTSP